MSATFFQQHKIKTLPNKTNDVSIRPKIAEGDAEFMSCAAMFTAHDIFSAARAADVAAGDIMFGARAMMFGARAIMFGTRAAMFAAGEIFFAARAINSAARDKKAAAERQA